MITLTTAAQLASVTSASIALGTVLFTRLVPHAKAKIRSRTLQTRLGVGLYPLGNLERSLRYYIPPFCQDVDPAGGDEPRLVFGVKTSLFSTLDDILNRDTEFRYIMILADSGMGKTSALLNYYARHVKRFRRPYHIALIPLGIPDADKRIGAISDKENTVLFLDALDEDTLAIVDHSERVRMLLQLGHDFKRIVITCRTQFFARDEEIPKRTAILKVGARAAGESAEYLFHKIYLSPFSDKQVKQYIHRLYPVWQSTLRKRALKMARRIQHLSARPMLLAHIDDLIRGKRNAETAYALYQEMVEAWLKREEGFIKNTEDLREFSERLAVDIYMNRVARGAERVPVEELGLLATNWNIPLDDWKLSGRSLLNRDAEGNFKFAHRSIMEYLYVRQLLRGNLNCLQTEWTDQMQKFLNEALESVRSVPRDSKHSIYLGNVELSGLIVLEGQAPKYLSIHDVAVIGLNGSISAEFSKSVEFVRCVQLIFGNVQVFRFSRRRGIDKKPEAQVSLSMLAASQTERGALNPELVDRAVRGSYRGTGNAASDLLRIEEAYETILEDRLFDKIPTLPNHDNDELPFRPSAVLLYGLSAPIGLVILSGERNRVLSRVRKLSGVLSAVGKYEEKHSTANVNQS